MIGQPAARAVDLTETAEPGYLAGPPLYWRLLAANLFVVLGGAVVGTALTRQFVLSGSFNLVTGVLMVVVAMSLSAILTGIILHIAFRPLRELRQAIEQSPAAEPTPVALLAASPDRFGDPDILAVSQAVRGLWDRLDQHVRLLEESNRRLEEQRRELAEKTVQLQRLAGLVIAAQEDERRRVARELHDDTMQSMAALLMGLEGVQQALPEGQPQTQAARLSVLRLRDLATRMLDELRHLALDLRPAVLDDHGLVAAVRWLAATLTERTGLPCRVTVSGDLPPEQRLPPATETALFRITQEALANVAKHAQATQCRVRLERTAGAISVRVEDNGAGLPGAPHPEGSRVEATSRPAAERATPEGVGMAPETPEAPEGAPAGPRQMGLFNMRERAALLGGTCTIRRRGASGGTVVWAELPLLSIPPDDARSVHSE